MGRTKCNVSSYEPSPKANYDAYIEPQYRSQPPRRYDALVIEPDTTHDRQRQPTTGYASMELDHYDDVEKFKELTRRQLLLQQLQRGAIKEKGGAGGGKLKYEEYDPAYDDGSLSDEVYIVRQNWGYFSILFSLAQTVIMVMMIVKCGIAPLKINPMVGPYPDVLSEWGAKNTVR
jgi:hypothetical protein